MIVDRKKALALAAAGRTSLAQKDYVTAIEQLTHASAASPDDAGILCDLGIAHAARGEFSTGHRQLTKIMKLMARQGGSKVAQAAFHRLEGHLGQP